MTQSFYLPRFLIIPCNGEHPRSPSTNITPEGRTYRDLTADSNTIKKSSEPKATTMYMHTLV
jgi:hypothetical protein